MLIKNIFHNEQAFEQEHLLERRGTHTGESIYLSEEYMYGERFCGGEEVGKGRALVIVNQFRQMESTYCGEQTHGENISGDQVLAGRVFLEISYICGEYTAWWYSCRVAAEIQGAS